MWRLGCILAETFPRILTISGKLMTSRKLPTLRKAPANIHRNQFGVCHIYWLEQNWKKSFFDNGKLKKTAQSVCSRSLLIFFEVNISQEESKNCICNCIENKYFFSCELIFVDKKECRLFFQGEWTFERGLVSGHFRGSYFSVQHCGHKNFENSSSTGQKLN